MHSEISLCSSKGLTSIPNEDQLTETHTEEGFQQLDKTFHQNKTIPTHHCEPDVQVKSETESDEYNIYNNSFEPRKWVVCSGGYLKEVLKMEHTDWSVETSTFSREQIATQEPCSDKADPAVCVLHTDVEASCVSAECPTQSCVPNVHVQSNTVRTQRTECNSEHTNSPSHRIHKNSLAKCLHNCTQKIQASKQHICSTCGKTFACSRHLVDHENSHSGIKPYVCSTCGKSFTQSCNRNVHERCHITVKPYTCPRCGQSFTQLWYLKVHERRHTGIKPYFYSPW